MPLGTIETREQDILLRFDDQRRTPEELESLVMWVFFNIRVSFWVAMGLPVSFLGAFLIAPHLGLSVNMFTMVGLLLALGLLMDDAIVIAENIAAHRQQGKGPLQAAIDGTKEVAAGVFSSFITTVCVLGPLAFIGGQIGRVLRVVPMILLLVLAVSLIEAFVILPAHLNHAMHHFDPRKAGSMRRRFDAFIEWLRQNLAGNVVNDSILLVIFLKNARTTATTLHDAAAATSRDRFRAVLLTSSTTIAGLIPILYERSLQAQILKPLVISTAFGLMASTLLVLPALPCFYVILGDLGWIEDSGASGYASLYSGQPAAEAMGAPRNGDLGRSERSGMREFIDQLQTDARDQQ